ncbi:MAG: hypothetical protein IJZ68_05515 [Bacteroidaceae bacterium]|nr:hypothetical protein [Bacteroidaceae bacterium]
MENASLHEHSQTTEALSYVQTESEASRRERRMKLTGAIMTVVLALCSGALAAIKASLIDASSMRLFAATIFASLIYALMLMARYELHEWHCFAQYTTELEYQTAAQQAEQSFQEIHQHIALLSYYPIFMFGVSCVIQYYNIVIPYYTVAWACIVISGIVQFLLKMLKTQYVPAFKMLKIIAILTAIAMAFASYI